MVSSRRMVLWCLILLLISAVSVPVHSQLDSNGFLSIDCGLSENSSYVDERSLTYVSDDKFIDTGFNSNISLDYVYVKNYSREYWTVRYFPDGIRNCYTLRSLTVGSNYLIRGIFYYANYDNKNNPPTFDIYIGVNFWNTVNATNSPSFPEIIVAANASFLEVCLVNTKQGTPFISSLHLRQLTGLYPYVNSTTKISLILVRRDNFGSSDSIVRYPDDKHDRWWYNNTYDSTWSAISTNASINYDEQDFETPPRVFQTAAATTNTNQPFVINWTSNDPTIKYCYILHFYETQDTSKTGSRDFYIYDRGTLFFRYPGPLKVGWVVSQPTGSTYYNVSLKATANSTLPPAMNAFELYTVATFGVPTYADDVAAINSIKDYYGINKGWSGDPCLPRQFIWNGIDCTNSSSGITRITSLNLSSSSLTGPLNDSFGYLTALEKLYVSSNDLSGDLTTLDSLTALKLLDITGNKHIWTALPPQLLKRQQDGMLIYRFGDISPSPSPPSPSTKKSNTTIIVAVVGGVATLLVVITICIWFQRKLSPVGSAKFLIEELQEVAASEFLIYNFTTIRNATNNFSDKNKLGRGGFGTVFKGTLASGQEIAAKRLSTSSTQGATEFKTEVELLVRLRHKNLVQLFGCCISKDERILCYEYLPNGSLDNILFGTDDMKCKELQWSRRYRIIKGTCRGLLYLHDESPLKIVHRDLKASNILLDREMNPKIADFGLARLFDRDQTHTSTAHIAGTNGYIAPEYSMGGKFSTKSDTYSFGILVLEIVSGRKNSSFPGSRYTLGLTNHVWKNWCEGKVMELKDPTLDQECQEEVRKCIHIALLCLQANPSNRPNMGTVANMLNSSSIESLPPLPPPRFIWGADVSMFGDDENVFTNLSREYSVAGVETAKESFLSSFNRRA